MDTLTPAQRREAAQKDLERLLDSEAAYRFMSGCSEFMTTEGLTLLKQAARNQQRWAFRLLTDAMKVLARLEMIRSTSTGTRTAPPVKVRARFATDGEKS